MIKGLAFAGAAAATTFLALLAVTHMLSELPDSAATAALIQTSDEADTLADQERIRTALTEQLRKQEEEIAALRRDLDAARAEISTVQKNEASHVLSVKSDGSELADRHNEPWQGEMQHLKDQLASATAEIETRDKRARALQSKIDQLDGELRQKDSSLNAMVARLTAAEKSTSTPDAVSGESPANAPAQPSTRAPAGALPSGDGGGPRKTASTDHTGAAPNDATVSDGIAAYRDGRFSDAFAIWGSLARRDNPQAQFHLGALYFEGRGIAADRDAARKWLERALAGGDTRARGLLQLLHPDSRSG